MNELIRKGLSNFEVLESRRRYGQNILTPPERDPWWKLFLEKFDDPVIRILLIAAVIAIGVGFVDGKFVEGIGIVSAILLATILAFFNEYKANKEFDILNKVNDDLPVKVIRDGGYCSIPKKDIVVGDLVLIEIGEEIPADGKIIESVSLQIDESKFTGESVPVNKYPKTELNHQKDNGATYSIDLCLRGAMVAEGHGTLEIIAVGDGTEVGKITIEASEENTESTTLNNQLEKLSKLIGVVGFGMAAITFIALVFRGAMIGEISLNQHQWIFSCTVVLSLMIALLKVWLPILYDAFELLGKDKEPPKFISEEGYKGWIITGSIALSVFITLTAVGYFLGHLDLNIYTWIPTKAARDFLDYFMVAVTIIVVAVPEGLAMSVTLSLAYSMRKMTATNNLVRKLHACETIGAANIICTDKTGTLTMNQMNVFESVFNSTEDNRPNEFISELISSNSTANLSHNESVINSLGNPTEGALLMWLNKNDYDYVMYRDNFKIESQLTFSTERKFMATSGISNLTNKKITYFKGAPEILIENCLRVLDKNNKTAALDGQKNEILSNLKSYQLRGMRTIGFAFSEELDYLSSDNLNNTFRDLVWVGFCALADPIRKEVPNAIRICSEAGINVKIVTGDNPETAKEIAIQIGLIDKKNSDSSAFMNGTEFNLLSDDEVKSRLHSLKVLARARPLDKLRLVNLLKEQNNVVAVTGDGTNDAPALNKANVGLAMGSGTAVAKEASDIILLDDSFTSIINAVNWGRSLYQNIQRFILFQLTINIAALSIALIGPFIGVSLPFTVTQMLWINLIMDTFAALALAAEPPHSSVMKDKPRNPDAFIVSKTMSKSIFGLGFIFVIFSITFILYMKRDGIITPYELSVFFSTFVMLQFWNLFNARCLGIQSSSLNGLRQNLGFVLIALGIFLGQILIVQFGGEFFRTTPLSFIDWIYIIMGTSIVFWIGEILRMTKRIKYKSSNGRDDF